MFLKFRKGSGNAGITVSVKNKQIAVIGLQIVLLKPCNRTENSTISVGYALKSNDLKSRFEIVFLNCKF